MTTPTGSAAPAPARPRSRRRDFWQLDVPLVLVLALCSVITVVEVRRAGEGVWRAWAYMVEWPLIGAFAVWIWHRYRTEGTTDRGTLTRGIAARYRERLEAYAAEADAESAADGVEPAQAGDDDPGLRAWQQHVAALRALDPPGGPPGAGRPG